MEEFCNLQRKRVELRHTQVLSELATEHARRGQEKADLDYEVASAALSRVELELSALEAERSGLSRTASAASVPEQ